MWSLFSFRSGGFVVALLHPLSLGELTLASADPRDYPLINPNFMSEKGDFDTIYQGIKFVLSLNQTDALKDIQLDITSIPACDEHDYFSDDWWYCYAQQTSISVSELVSVF